MNEIAKIVGFDYSLYFSPDGRYGSGKDNGMIGEVYHKVSTKTKLRKVFYY